MWLNLVSMGSDWNLEKSGVEAKLSEALLALRSCEGVALAIKFGVEKRLFKEGEDREESLESDEEDNSPFFTTL